MNIWPILAVMFASFTGSFAQLMLKQASVHSFWNLIFNKRFIAAVAIYGINSVIFITALKFEKLVVLYPVVATSFIWTSMLAVKFLGEHMNKYKWGGIALIIVGVVLVAI